MPGKRLPVPKGILTSPPPTPLPIYDTTEVRCYLDENTQLKTKLRRAESDAFRKVVDHVGELASSYKY
ncbi:unnamed protein product [Soboliphyme baturini]|uniref:Transposase n=1 Tax=Soboliphyme baturini TaxID=241478 RepID=A0A183ITJ4_9BILA|nr:unnamed protein product [Soboliphyme baturini]